MDHLDIPQNRDTHQICYDLPRICKVTREDFDFVMRVDRHRLRLHSFGRLLFWDVTPYSAPPTTTEPPSRTEPQLADDVHVRSSFDDWLHPSGSGGPSEQEVPTFYQPYMTEMNEHIEHDIDELSKSMAVEYKVKCKAICQKRMAEMIAKISKGPCSTCNATSKASTSGGMPPEGEKSGPDDVDIDIETKIASMVIDAAKEGACLDSSNANPIPSPPRNQFDFMKSQPDDTVGSKTETVREPTTTAPNPVAAHELDVGGSKMSSCSFEKKNRRRRAAVDLNLGKKPKKIKLEEDAKEAYENYVTKKLEMKRRRIGASSEQPS